MNEEMEYSIDIALVHYPVLNKAGEKIGSAVTNLDIHDIARAARTFGVKNYYIVTPYTDQHDLIHEITAHWKDGYGATYNPARKRALDMVSVSTSIEQTVEELTGLRGRKPQLVTTSAVARKNSISYRQCRDMIKDGQPILLLFGTAHGLAPEVMNMADMNLPPISGNGEYNHLSVRSAVSIILDRLLGCRE